MSLSGDPGRQVVTGSSIARGPPFGSVAPETLLARGFAFEDKGTTTFAAPDAPLLVSRQFTEWHCLRAVPPESDSGLIGLHFEPTGQRHRPDVEGTLWVDRVTSELRFMEFSYTDLGPQLRTARLGGRIDFRRLATGAWIVSRWYVRMPRMAVTPATEAHGWRGDPEGSRLVGYVDQGGEATVAPSGRDVGRHAHVIGSVFDSTTMTALPNAAIRLYGHADSVMSDSAGRFAIQDDGGWRRLSVAHRKLGLLSDSSEFDVPMSVGDTAHVQIAVPSIRTFVRQLCGDEMPMRTAIVGLVSLPDDTPLEDVEIAINGDSLARSTDPEALSGPRGLFAFCDIPADRSLTLRVRRRGQSRAPGAWVTIAGGLRLHAGDLRWIDLRLPRPH